MHKIERHDMISYTDILHMFCFLDDFAPDNIFNYTITMIVRSKLIQYWIKNYNQNNNHY